MTSRQMRSLFVKARRLAAGLASRCDFAALDRIKKASANCGHNDSYVSIVYKDDIERAQILAAFTYGAALIGLSLSCNRLEDARMENGLSIVILNLSAPATEGK